MAVELSIGQRFGSWTVEEKLDYKQKYKCRCDCGRTRNIRVYDLTKSKTTACRSCSLSATKRTHGMVNTSEYNSWSHMIQRTTNPKNKDYKNYGGRGITVCDLWRDSFEAFYMMMGPKPSPDYTIERVDYNKGYEPGNCTWASREDQTRNKRDNIHVELFGDRLTVSQWGRDERTPVDAQTIYKRIARGWDPVEAVTTPKEPK